MNFIVKPQQESAVKEMFMAEKYFSKDSIDKALMGDGNFPGFLQIIDDYGSSQAANLSHYYAGMCYMKKKQWDEAIDYLKSYDAEDDITGALALGAIGDAYLEKGDKDEALNYYEKAAGWDDNDFSAPIFMKKAAMVYELDSDYRAAIDIYKNIKKKYPSSTEGREIDKYIARAEALAQ
jgi:tetratricopeptide (TPR) repeat protein